MTPSCWAARRRRRISRRSASACARTLSLRAGASEAERQFKKNLDAIYTQLEHTAEGVMQNEVVGFIHSGDTRFRFPKREVMAGAQHGRSEGLADAGAHDGLHGGLRDRRRRSRTRRWKCSQRPSAPCRSARTKSLTTPTRAQVTFPSSPHDKDFSFSTEIPRAYALAYWPTDGHAGHQAHPPPHPAGADPR